MASGAETRVPLVGVRRQIAAMRQQQKLRRRRKPVVRVSRGGPARTTAFQIHTQANQPLEFAALHGLWRPGFALKCDLADAGERQTPGGGLSPALSSPSRSPP
jgi:hypothetical protein